MTYLVVRRLASFRFQNVRLRSDLGWVEPSVCGCGDPNHASDLCWELKKHMGRSRNDGPYSAQYVKLDVHESFLQKLAMIQNQVPPATHDKKI
eukprot:1948430-Amphidinium_carterae.2